MKPFDADSTEDGASLRFDRDRKPGPESMLDRVRQIVLGLREYFALTCSKLPKLMTLARERVMLARAAVSPRRNRPGARRSTTEAALPERDRPADERCWSWRSELTMSQPLLDLVELFPQDRRTGSGRMVSEFDYSVATLRHATVFTNEYSHRSVYDGDGRARPALSSFRGRGRTSPKRVPAPARVISGRTVSAYGNIAMAGGNFGHWMIDGIAMLFLVSRVESLDDFDQVLVPPMFYDFHVDSLALFGFPRARVVELPALEVMEFDELVCTTAPRGNASAIQPGWAIDGFRERVFGPSCASDGAHRGRLLYVSRRDAKTRKFVNEEALCTFLEVRGFETVELSGYDLAGKARLFAEARCVIGLSGAGMINAMFLSPSATLIEIFPPSLPNYGAASICAHLGCRHEFLLARDASAVSRMNRYYGELLIDLETVEIKLRDLGLA